MKRNKHQLKVFYYQEMMSSEEAKKINEERRIMEQIEEATKKAVRITIENMIKEGKVLMIKKEEE